MQAHFSILSFDLRVVENGHPHIVGISTPTVNSDDGMIAATVAKSAFADTLTGAGGVHFRASPRGF